MWIWSFGFERYQATMQCELTVDINIIDIPDKQAAAKAQCNGQTKSCLRFSKINIIWSYCEQNSRSPLFFDKGNLFYVQSAAITKRTYFEKYCIVRLYLPKDQRQSFNDIKVIVRVVILVSQNPFLLYVWFLVKKDGFEELHIFAAHGSNVPTCTGLANDLIYIKPIPTHPSYSNVVSDISRTQLKPIHCIVIWAQICIKANPNPSIAK